MEVSSNIAVLLIVQNNSYPFDNRVLKESISLKNAGYDVFVISPQSFLDRLSYQVIDDVKIHRFKNILSDGSFTGYIIEYCNSLIRIYYLFFKLHLKNSFAVVHVANPPDLFWPLAVVCKFFGVKFIYDQHDLVPEMFRIRFGGGWMYKIIQINEYLTAKLAHLIIVANGTFQKRSMKLWNIKPNKYVVVPNGPIDAFAPRYNQNLHLQYGNRKIILYVGLMSKNDNIEIVIQAAMNIVTQFKRTDCHFILLGGGDVEEQMEKMAMALGLSSHLEFKGLVNQNVVMEYLDIANVCIIPDLPNGMNEKLTHVKVLEYMKAGKAFVGFRLQETMDMASGCGLFAKDVNDFTSKILYLIDNPDEARKMGQAGCRRVENGLSWTVSEKKMLTAYKDILSKKL